MVNFDSTNITNQFVVIDSTTDSLHLWQIGLSSKIGFQYSSNVIMTDSVAPYPINAHASFIIKSTPHQIIYSSLSFKSSFDTDSSKDGGYVEYSMDTGTTWRPVRAFHQFGGSGGYSFFDPEYIPSPNSYTPSDTNSNGLLFFSGKSYNQTTFIKFNCYALKTEWNEPLWFRFTFTSDSVQNNKVGWIIDDIQFTEGLGVCSGINNVGEDAFSVAINPNPFIDILAIKLSNLENPYDVEILFTDLTGRLIRKVESSGNHELIIKREDLKAAVYFVNIKDLKSGNMISKKVVVE
jgi:hypothetical protein